MPRGRKRTIALKREIAIDRSLYTPDVARELSRRNGSGKGLAEIARRDLRRMLRAEGDARPAWMRIADAREAFGEAA